jgi:hypothetical protein
MNFPHFAEFRSKKCANNDQGNYQNVLTLLSRIITNGGFEDIKVGLHLFKRTATALLPLLITDNECKGFHIKV